MGGGKGGGGGGQGANIDAAIRLGDAANARENIRFNQGQQDAQRASGLLNALTGSGLEGSRLLRELGLGAANIGADRLNRERTSQGLAGESASRLAALSGDIPDSFTRTGNLQRGLGFQASRGHTINNLLSTAQQLGQAGNIDPQDVEALRGIGQTAVGQSEQIGQDLAGLRGGSLRTLERALQGDIPGNLESLFTPSGTSERDVLEAQFGVAERAAAERGGARGAGLSQNLASLQGQRALALGEQAARRDEAVRQAGLGLFQQALGQGLTAPQQQQQALGLGLGAFQGAGGLELGQGGLRAATLRGQGQLELGAERARQAQLGLASGIFGQGLQSDLAARQQQAGILGQDFAQRLNLANAQGRGADQLRFGISPQLLQNSFGLLQGATQGQGIPSQILAGVPTSSAASFLGPALGAGGQQAELRSNQNAALGSGIGAAAGGVIGSVVPGIGTAVGIGLGGALGGGIGGKF